MSQVDGAVSTEFHAPKLPEGVLDFTTTEPIVAEGQKAFVYYNGPTDQLSGVSAGACILAEHRIVDGFLQHGVDLGPITQCNRVAHHNLR